MTHHIPDWAYKLAIVAATVVWGGSFTVMKGALDAMTPGWLLALRFAAAAAVMAALFAPRLVAHADARHLRAGVAIGLTYGIAYLVQNVGLTGTTPGKNAFLTATYCVMVPFMNAAVSRRAPAARNVGAACACLVGVALIAVGGDTQPAGAAGEAAGAGIGGVAASLVGLFALAPGDALTLVGAVFFAINIVQIGRLNTSDTHTPPSATVPDAKAAAPVAAASARDADAAAPALDVITITVVQMATCAAICLAWALVAEPLPTPGALTPTFWAQMAYIVLLSTVFASIAQNVGQQHVPPSQAALLLSLESVFGAVFSVLFYGETATPALVAGFALIFASVVVSELAPSRNG